MPADAHPIGLAPATADGRTSLHLLVDSAIRQLNVCNSCRYCEGFCAVYPALERRTLLNAGDVTQLANLCHDCRACFDACMYTTPHEFDINIPQALTEVRLADYKRLTWPKTVPRIFSGRTGLFAGSLVSLGVFVIVALVHAGPSGLVRRHSAAASPYALIPYPALLVLLLVPAVFSLVIMAFAGRAYWREIGGAPDGVRLRAVGQAVLYAATMRYLGGGGGDCYYPRDDRPSPLRRNLHALVAYGFGLCLVSTISAGVLQDFLDTDPPYSLISLPVLSGLIGGIGLLIGSVGLLALKVRSSPATSVADMTTKDYGFLVALCLLALTGLLTLLTRDSSAYGLTLLAHLAAIGLTFAVAPYSKFIHLEFRLLALFRDNIERNR